MILMQSAQRPHSWKNLGLNQRLLVLILLVPDLEKFCSFWILFPLLQNRVIFPAYFRYELCNFNLLSMFQHTFHTVSSCLPGKKKSPVSARPTGSSVIWPLSAFEASLLAILKSLLKLLYLYTCYSVSFEVPSPFVYLVKYYSIFETQCKHRFCCCCCCCCCCRF